MEGVALDGFALPRPPHFTCTQSAKPLPEAEPEVAAAPRRTNPCGPAHRMLPWHLPLPAQRPHPRLELSRVSATSTAGSRWYLWGCRGKWLRAGVGWGLVGGWMPLAEVQRRLRAVLGGRAGAALQLRQQSICTGRAGSAARCPPSLRAPQAVLSPSQTLRSKGASQQLLPGRAPGGCGGCCGVRGGSNGAARPAAPPRPVLGDKQGPGG